MLRSILACLEPRCVLLTDAEREWLLAVAETREVNRRRAQAIQDAYDRVADESSAVLETPDARARREFWQAIPVAPRSPKVRPFGQRRASGER